MLAAFLLFLVSEHKVEHAPSISDVVYSLTLVLKDFSFGCCSWVAGVPFDPVASGSASAAGAPAPPVVPVVLEEPAGVLDNMLSNLRRASLYALSTPLALILPSLL